MDRSRCQDSALAAMNSGTCVFVESALSKATGVAVQETAQPLLFLCHTLLSTFLEQSLSAIERKPDTVS